MISDDTFVFVQLSCAIIWFVGYIIFFIVNKEYRQNVEFIDFIGMSIGVTFGMLIFGFLFVLVICISLIAIPLYLLFIFIQKL